MLLDEYNVCAKIKAMEQYQTELRDYPHVRSVSKLENLLETRGGEVNADFAEAFVKIREIV